MKTGKKIPLNVGTKFDWKTILKIYKYLSLNINHKEISIEFNQTHSIPSIHLSGKLARELAPSIPSSHHNTSCDISCLDLTWINQIIYLIFKASSLTKVSSSWTLLARQRSSPLLVVNLFSQGARFTPV